MKKIIKFMKSNYKIILLVFILAGILVSFNIKQKSDPEKDKILLRLLKYALMQGHYQPQEINDDFSERVFTGFIDNLDPLKRFFTQEDIKALSIYKDKIDDQLKDENLDFFNAVFSKYQQRVNEARGFYKEILKHPFDFDKDETYNVEYDKQEYPKSEIDLIVNWRKQLKLSTLNRLYVKIEDEETKQKDSAGYTPNSFAELEEEARKNTEKSMEEFFDSKDRLNHDDIFSLYLNSISTEFDPHTSYFAPQIKKRFDVDMAGKIEGIGARLQQRGDYTKVDELISGGPAWRDGNLEVGDIILKVAQAEGEALDIVGMRLDDAIEYIKGEKGTLVKLTVKKLDGTIKVIPIVRDLVLIEETFAKTSLVKKDGKKFAVINLPKFYIDFSERNFRNSATDMALEIDRLNKENVDGLVLDLRNNGGGSLETAIDIAGLFIEEGPVVQVKNKNGKPQVRSDKDPRIQWNKPLVVLVNELSASASEIFAAAMQDYNRAVIIGSKQTFGKGTVQNLLSLNNYVKYDPDLGALKMTIQKFYRINGGSTQLNGVTPDVIVPNKFSYLDIGEKDEVNPLSWDKISSASYKKWNGYKNFNQVVENSINRVNGNEAFKVIDENAKWLKKGQDNDKVPLNFEKYKEDLLKREQEGKRFDSLFNFNNHLTFTSPQYEKPLIAQDSILAKKREVWHKNLSKDIYVEEALNVLVELEVKKYEPLVKN
ncbi:MAG: tail-specific protease [Flavobacteriales bacterium]|nr:MAG: tail-specific protease [Flavobacteriales bacterium]